MKTRALCLLALAVLVVSVVSWACTQVEALRAQVHAAGSIR